MPHVALGHHGPSVARAAIAALVIAATGCASTRDPTQDRERPAAGEVGGEGPAAGEVKGNLGGAAGAVGGAAVGAVGGAAVGAIYGLTCGPAAIICSPVGLVLGGAYGLVKGAQAGAKWGENAGAIAGTNASANTNRSAYTEVRKDLVYIGDIAASDFSPSGSLSVDAASVSRTTSGANVKLAEGTLVVNLDNTVDKLYTSILVDVSVTCDTGEAGFGSRRTYDGWNGEGRLRSMEQSTSGLAPGSVRDAAVRTLCTRESAR
jgi:hypothetical protein